MAEANTYEEHLHYNEKKENIKNIAFDPRWIFEPFKKFVDPCHKATPTLKFLPRP